MQKQKIKPLELKKHVGTIHCANSLSLLQRKIANALLYHAYNDLLHKDEHQIPIRDICSLIGYDSHDYKTIKRALVDLLSTVIEWNIIDEGLPSQEGEWNASSIIADASIKNGMCSYSYSKRMRQLLYMPAIYGRLNMQLQAKFKSSYGLALYENVIRYQNLAQTPWFTLPIFRKLMGVQAEKYLIFRDLKRRVLDAAVMEVNTVAKIAILPEFRKEQRNVVAIRFLITSAQDKLRMQSTTTLLEENSLTQSSEQTIKFISRSNDRLEILDEGQGSGEINITERLSKDFGMNPKQIQEIVSGYEQNYILEKIKIIESSPSFQAGKILNLAKYLMSALAHDYQAPKASSKVNNKRNLLIEQQEALQKNEALQQAQLRKNYEKYLSAQFQADINRLSQQEYRQIEANFFQQLQGNSGDILLHLYKKEGINNKMIAVEFRNFVKEKYPTILTEVESFARYKQALQVTRDKK